MVADAGGSLSVEVVLAFPERQELIAITLPSGASVGEAIEAALPRLFPDVDLDALQPGIWGRPVDRSTLLADGDRVELYRPLEIDPRDARRSLAAAGRSMSGQTTPSAQGPGLRDRD